MDDMQEYLVSEFIELYEDGELDRDVLERRILGILGEADGAAMLAGVPIVPRRPSARQVLTAPIAGGAGLETKTAEIPIEGGTLIGYLARPEWIGTRPAVVAIHENRGLVEHTKDCARRLADAGYVTLAVDLLSREGGTAKVVGSGGDATVALGQADAEQNTRDIVAAIDWLAKQPDVDSRRIGVTGWCMGGGYTWRTAIQAGNKVRAAVPWYGGVPRAGVENIQTPVFAIYGGLDERVNAGIPTITEEMEKNHKSFEKKIYPDAQHAFNNDTNAERYNPEQAKIAWADMLSFFDKQLKAGTA
jgi:carboxymethylenebutenolidase